MQEAHNYRKQDQLFHMVMHLPCALAAVSEAVQVRFSHVRAPIIMPNVLPGSHALPDNAQHATLPPACAACKERPPRTNSCQGQAWT